MKLEDSIYRMRRWAMNWNASALCAPAAAHPLVRRLSNVNVSFIQNWTTFKKKKVIIVICL